MFKLIFCLRVQKFAVFLPAMKKFVLLLIVGLSFVGCKEQINDIPPVQNRPIPLDIFFDTHTGCYPLEPSAETFEIATWNIENFPVLRNESTPITLQAVKTIIESSGLDFIAVQEIVRNDDFFAMLESMPDWEGVIAGTNLTQKVGYMYKTTEVEITESMFTIFNGSEYASPFPRRPAVIKARHANGLEILFINLHLKCCGTTTDINRRKEAARLLKDYIDTNHPNDMVIVLGDYNDNLLEQNNTVRTTFENFILDTENYRFTDLVINQFQNSTHWSYPSWPSHLDHILVTNELYDHVEYVQTMTLDLNNLPSDCIPNYRTQVSDHRPVMIQLTNSPE
jgi:endonuclease/exonuclease/phosphatase family metal-dependent hydrolase